MTLRRRPVAITTSALFAGSSAISGQEARPVPPGTYGTTANIVHHLSPEDFSPWHASWSNLWMDGSSVSARIPATVGVSAPLHLPNGAVVDSFVYFYFDNNPTRTPTAEFRFTDSFGNLVGSTPVQFPDVSNGPNVLPVVLQTPVTINNQTARYSVFFTLDAESIPDAQIFLYGVRVNYRLQVSPAPGTATFADVPVGSQFHRFVEALNAAGITGGCGGGNYCPNAPITRGQMAVFLAAALGLHWPN